MILTVSLHQSLESSTAEWETVCVINTTMWNIISIKYINADEKNNSGNFSVAKYEIISPQAGW